MQINIKTDQELDNSKIYDVSSKEGFMILSDLWLEAAHWQKWMWGQYYGVPIVQFPSDFYFLHRVVEKSNPSVIIETGTSYGGGSIFFAAQLLVQNILGDRDLGTIITIDVYNPDNILNNPKEKDSRMQEAVRIKETRIKTAEVIEKLGIKYLPILGSSIDSKILTKIRNLISLEEEVLVILDSSHVKEHVDKELLLYATLVNPGGYIIVCDTYCHRISDKFKEERLWDFKADPLFSVKEFLSTHDNWEMDEEFTTYPISAIQYGVIRKKRT